MFRWLPPNILQRSRFYRLRVLWFIYRSVKMRFQTSNFRLLYGHVLISKISHQTVPPGRRPKIFCILWLRPHYVIIWKHRALDGIEKGNRHEWDKHCVWLQGAPMNDYTKWAGSHSMQQILGSSTGVGTLQVHEKIMRDFHIKTWSWMRSILRLFWWPWRRLWAFQRRQARQKRRCIGSNHGHVLMHLSFNAASNTWLKFVVDVLP